MEALTAEERHLLETNDEASIAGTVPVAIYIDTPERLPWDKDYVYTGESLAGLAAALRKLADQYDALHAEGYTMYGPNEKYGTINFGGPER